jgi:hypothetical protein
MCVAVSNRCDRVGTLAFAVILRRIPGVQGDDIDTEASSPPRPGLWARSLLAACAKAWPAIVIGLAAPVLVLVITARSPGYTPDSASYLGMAQNLRAGLGPTVPFDFVGDGYSPRQAVRFAGAVPSTGFPPLYPALIATVAVTTRSSVDQAGRWLGAVVAGVNAVLFAAIARRCLRRRSWLLGATTATLLTVTVWWILAHACIWSESLFMVWVFGAVLAVPGLLAAPTRRRLAVAGLLGAAAVLTRWVGLSVPAALGLACLWNRAWPVPNRLWRALAVAGPGAAAGAAWWLYGTIASARGGPGVLAYHPPKRLILSMIDLFSAWLLGPDPRTAGAVPFVLLTVGLASAAFVATIRRRRSAIRREGASSAPPMGSDHVRLTTLRFLAVFAILYLAVVSGSRTFLDVTLPVTTTANFFGRLGMSRVFLPLLPVLVCIVLVTGEHIGRGIGSPLRGRVPWETLFAGCLILVVPGVFVTHSWATGYNRYIENSLRPPSSSPVLAALRHVDHSALVATTSPDLMWLGARRPSVQFPRPTAWLTGKRNRAYEAELTELSGLLCQRGGIAVIFGPPLLAQYESGVLRGHAQLTKLATYPDGSVFAVTATNGATATTCRPPPPLPLDLRASR